MSIQYARLRHDTTRAVWKNMSRTNPANPNHVKQPMAPETVRYSGDSGQVSLIRSFVNWIKRICLPEAFSRMIRIANGWVNRSLWPVVQQIGFGGNVIRVLKIEGTRVYADWLNFRKPAPASKTYQSDPCLVHVFTVVDQAGAISLPTNKFNELMCFICIVARKTIWFDVGDVELFPQLPLFLEPHRLLKVYDAPSMDAKLLHYVEGNLMIVAYEPHGSEVWAQLDSGGWICLYHPKTGYSTTWWMETTPPPVI